MSSKSHSPLVTVPARPNRNLAQSINARTAAAPVACSNLVAAAVAVRKVRTRGRAVVAAKNSTSDPANAVAAVVAMLETAAMAAAVFRRNRSNPIH